MIVQIYSVDEKAEDLSEIIEVQTAADAEKLVFMIKEYGYEDDKGEHYRFGVAKVIKQGVVVYVER